LDATYLVAETDTGLVLIDQHAADERVHYERLRDQVAADTRTQALAEPVQIQVTPAEADRLSTPVHQAALDRLGVRARCVGSTTVAVDALPAPVAETAGPELVGDLLAALTAGPEAAEQTVADAVDALLADLACHPAITGNTSLTEGSAVRLLEALDATENPWACPHGRPVVIQIDNEEIATRFERDYPGHRAE
ncbi:MAG: DNA mismatch repair enzyme (putative ATPase), partial [halophilic archaeon J07HX5]